VVQEIIVRTYKGSPSGTAKAFQRDAARLAEKGYFPISQSWHGAREDLVLWHGLLSFVYVLRALLKPAGTLTATYEKRVV
jgi:hypothetical protein